MLLRSVLPGDRLVQALYLTSVSHVDVCGMPGKIDSRTSLSLHEQCLGLSFQKRYQQSLVLRLSLLFCKTKHRN
jgi:hypothetical protein